MVHNGSIRNSIKPFGFLNDPYTGKLSLLIYIRYIKFFQKLWASII